MKNKSSFLKVPQPTGPPRRFRKTSRTLEQVLLDKITTAFGPHIEDISIRQDFFLSAGQDPSSSTSLPFLPAQTSSSASSFVQLLATAAVPKHNPRIFIGNWIHLQWLRELKIVFRATIDRPLFLYSPTFDPLQQSCSRVSSSLHPRPPSTPVPLLIDLSACCTLETLWIEDFDHRGRPQRLHCHRQLDLFKVLVVPFHQNHGLKLPLSLKSLEIIGLSAERFNFAWLGSTPRLEYLQILGLRRCQGLTAERAASEAPAETLPMDLSDIESLWQWERIELPLLRHMVIHHSPARHFRFGILRHCPRLESFDIRDISPKAFQVPRFISFEQQTDDEQDLRGEATDILDNVSTINDRLTTCKLDVLPVPDATSSSSSSPSVTAKELAYVFETFLQNVIQLHVNGVPARVLIEVTSGPSNRSQEYKTARMRRLDRIITTEKASAQDILDYCLVHSTACVAAADDGEGASLRAIASGNVIGAEVKDPGDAATGKRQLRTSRDMQTRAIKSFGLKMHPVCYTIRDRDWQRMVP